MAAYPQEANNAIYPSDQGFDSSKTDSKEKIDNEKATGPDLRSGKVADNGFGGGEGSKNFRTMTKWDTVFVSHNITTPPRDGDK